MTQSKAQVLAAHLLAQLAANGIDHVFVAPGARSQALAIAAGQLAEAGQIQLHARLDERSMAFQALGVGLSSGFPAAVITTSGTAVANLHPAVLEAHHAGVPMILLTADRPAELRGIGSNQTTNQVGIFADAVLQCIDVPAPASTDSDVELADQATKLARQAVFESVSYGGPIQLNLGFRDPLSAEVPNAAQILDGLIAEGTIDQSLSDDDHVHGPDCDHGLEEGIELQGIGAADSVIDLALKTIVVAGDAGDLARWYCTGVPLLAEPSSGVRGLDESIPGYLWILEQEPELVAQIQQILVFGKPTLNRPLQALLRNPAIRVFSDPGRHGVFNPGHNTHLLGDDVEFLGDSDPNWLKSWRDASAKHLDANAAQVTGSGSNEATSKGVTRPQLVQKVFAAADELNPLVLGASRLIRVAERWAPAKQIQVYANRGLAGIDGTVATASGIALTEPGATTRVLLGDLTLLHDSGSLVIDANDANLNIQLIVGNDNGGTIFNGLEVAQVVPSELFTQLFNTPQAVNLEALASAYGWQYFAVTTVSELESVLKLSGHVLVDVKLVD